MDRNNPKRSEMVWKEDLKLFTDERLARETRYRPLKQQLYEICQGVGPERYEQTHPLALTKYVTRALALKKGWLAQPEDRANTTPIQPTQPLGHAYFHIPLVCVLGIIW
eukprot:4302299-Amphidinium_carterae.1